MTRTRITFATIAVASLLFGGVATGSAQASTTSTRPTAVSALAHLAVKGKAAKTGYARSLFGPAWADVDRNGCDTRNDVLNAYLTAKTYKTGHCIVQSGVLVDPYSGARIVFRRGVATSRAIEIDHVVALDNSWVTGSFRWSAATRLAFANDPLNLQPTAGRLNQQKSASDAASWLPPLNAARCPYVARQIAVKQKYALWVTSAEKAAMARVLTTCPAQRLP